jgi:hypothetical protein
MWSNLAPAPDRRRLFALGLCSEFYYPFSTPPFLPAAAGEVQRSVLPILTSYGRLQV